MEIVVDDLSGEPVARFLAAHLAEMRSVTPEEGVLALDLSGLRDPAVTVWTALDGAGEIVGCAALRRLGPEHGELKSMRVDPARRGEGIGRALLRHVLAAARAEGLTRVSLETGTQPHFAAARALYRAHGFVPGPPFGDYVASPYNSFWTLSV